MHEFRIMLVDDHPLFRHGLRRIIEQDPRLKVVAEAGTGHQALHQAGIHRPALVLLDIHLPGVTGLQVAAALRQRGLTTKVIFLSAHADDDRLLAAIRVGAAGFLTKDAEPGAVLAAVDAVLRGESLLLPALLTNPNLARRVFGTFRSSSEGRGGAVPPEARLLPRELDVLDCLVMGRSNKEIGEALFITEQTVKNYVTSIMRKFKVNDRVAALRYAVTHGWAEIGPRPYAEVARSRAVAGSDADGSASPRSTALRTIPPSPGLLTELARLGLPVPPDLVATASPTDGRTNDHDGGRR